MASPANNEPAPIEPEPIPCLYLSGATVEPDPNVLRCVGWIDLDGASRVVLRFALPLKIARKFHAEIGKRLRAAAAVTKTSKNRRL